MFESQFPRVQHLSNKRSCVPSSVNFVDENRMTKVMQKRVHQCTLALTGPGMNNESGLLVNHDQVVVFVNDLERNRFGHSVDLFRRRLVDFNAIVGANEITRPGGGAVERHEVVSDQL